MLFSLRMIVSVIVFAQMSILKEMIWLVSIGLFWEGISMETIHRKQGAKEFQESFYIPIKSIKKA